MKNIPHQRKKGAKTVFSLFFSRNTYEKTIWVSSAISPLTQEVPVRRRDVIVRLSYFVTLLVTSFVALWKGLVLVSTELLGFKQLNLHTLIVKVEIKLVSKRAIKVIKKASLNRYGH